MAKLAELGTIITGNTPKTADAQNYATNDICFVKPSDIADGEVNRLSNTEFYISDYARSKARIIPPNSVLVTCIGIVGKVAINEVECAFNQQINAIVPETAKCIPEYIAFALQSKQMIMQDIANAAVVPILNKAQFSEICIQVPSLEEQQVIVDKMNKISELITLRKEQLAKLDELVKARFVEMFGDPVVNPKGWDVHLIENIVANEKNALKAGPFGSALKKEYYVSSGYKIYGQEQVISGDHTLGDYYIDEERYQALQNCAVQAGDVLISLVGTYGKLLIIPEKFEPGIINPRLMKITFDKKKVNPYYFQYYFQSDSLKNALADKTHGGTMDILNLGIVRKLAMPLPPLILQNEFLQYVKQANKTKLTIRASLDKLEVMKKALMQEYFG